MSNLNSFWNVDFIFSNFKFAIPIFHWISQIFYKFSQHITHHKQVSCTHSGAILWHGLLCSVEVRKEWVISLEMNTPHSWHLTSFYFFTIQSSSTFSFCSPSVRWSWRFCITHTCCCLMMRQGLFTVFVLHSWHNRRWKTWATASRRPPPSPNASASLTEVPLLTPRPSRPVSAPVRSPAQRRFQKRLPWVKSMELHGMLLSTWSLHTWHRRDYCSFNTLPLICGHFNSWFWGNVFFILTKD